MPTANRDVTPVRCGMRGGPLERSASGAWSTPVTRLGRSGLPSLALTENQLCQATKAAHCQCLEAGLQYVLVDGDPVGVRAGGCETKPSEKSGGRRYANDRHGNDRSRDAFIASLSRGQLPALHHDQCWLAA
jgi:hypothetical protein